MMKNKSEVVKRRLRRLTITALILGILAIWTGFFGFFRSPQAAAPQTESVSAETPEESYTAPVQPQSPPPVMNEDSAPMATSALAVSGEIGKSNIDYEPQNAFRLYMRMACCICLLAEIVDVLLLLMLLKNIREHKKRPQKTVDGYRSTKVAPIPITLRNRDPSLHPITDISLGKIHDMGSREYQQDNFGQTAVLDDTGILVVLADGMGGLSNGGRVSQRIVMEALNYGVAIQADQLSNALPDMVNSINQAINQMLGSDGLYTSGSTVVSALIVKDALWWISVGDSRIYLFRDQQLSQISRDHDLLQDWMGEILEGKRAMVEAADDPDGRKLTSFIGMGELRYIDCNHTSIPLQPGDWILLMSDGIYGTVSDAEMEAILQSAANVQDAASRIGKKIADAALPYQDNYTLVILGYDFSK